MVRLWPLLSFLTVAGSTFAQAPLSPTAFPELPRNILADLQRRHCKIPQLLHEKKVNVIKGEFCEARPNRLGRSLRSRPHHGDFGLLEWLGDQPRPDRSAGRRGAL